MQCNTHTADARKRISTESSHNPIQFPKTKDITVQFSSLQFLDQQLIHQKNPEGRTKRKEEGNKKIVLTVFTAVTWSHVSQVHFAFSVQSAFPHRSPSLQRSPQSPSNASQDLTIQRFLQGTGIQRNPNPSPQNNEDRRQTQMLRQDSLATSSKHCAA